MKYVIIVMREIGPNSNGLFENTLVQLDRTVIEADNTPDAARKYAELFAIG